MLQAGLGGAEGGTVYVVVVTRVGGEWRVIDQSDAAIIHFGGPRGWG